VTTTLVLVRHGEIVRPMDTSNFDSAPLSANGRRQVEALARAWPTEAPGALVASPLLRARQTAEVLADHFRLPVVLRPCLTEWTADPSGIPQPEYMALERRAWADLDWVPPSGESLAMAGSRAEACVQEIAAECPGRTVAAVGHGTLFSLLTSRLRGRRPTEAYKASIGFAHAAILSAGSELRLVRDFAACGAPEPSSKAL